MQNPNLSLYITNNIEKQQMVTFKKPEPANVWHFYLLRIDVETMLWDTIALISRNKCGDVCFGSLSVFVNPSVLA